MVEPITMVALAAAAAGGGALFGGGLGSKGNRSLVNASRFEDSRQYQLKKDTQISNVDSRSFQTSTSIVDARSLTLTLNSPNATTSSKKDIGASLVPSLSPALEFQPSIGSQGQEGRTDFSGAGAGSLLIYAGIGLLGYGGYKYVTRKKKKK